jgi:Ca2+-transporting ATPase
MHPPLARWRRLLRSLKSGPVHKILVAVAGGSVLLVGIAMLVLPGPAFLVIPLGLAILATEFLWAKAWLKRARALLPGGRSPGSTAVQTVARPWHQLPSGEALQFFHVLAATGLPATEAAKRLLDDGPNRLADGKRSSAWRILGSQFMSIIIWVLIVAGIISSVLGEAVDAIAILAIVVLNAAVGFYQEFNAEKSIAALRQLTAPRALVRRDGRVVLIPAAQVVTGDILLLEAGDLVAADARLIATASLRCIESALTGEAAAVTKRSTALEPGEIPLGDRKNMVYLGTSVAAGTGEAVVVATAMQTELGRIAALLATAGGDEETPLQRRLDSVGRVLVWAALGIVALLFGLGLLRGTSPMELFLTSISLAVAAVPEGLPAVVTVALSLGAARMARRRALVRKLAAVETLGSTTVICTDKTGTLTVGEMTARALNVAGQTYEVTGAGYGPAGEVRLAGGKVPASSAGPLRELAAVLLGSNHAQVVESDGIWSTLGDPTEGALLVAGVKAGGDREQLERECPKLYEFPFDSDRKRSSVIRRIPGGAFRVFSNGAPGPLLECCTHLLTRDGVRTLTAADRDQLLAEISSLARQGLRVLGSARRELAVIPPAGPTARAIERDLVFVGLTGMYDPPRPEAKAAVTLCRTAGIRVVMITGDHPETAEAIARELGLVPAGDVPVTGVELEKMSDANLQQRAPRVSVYARVTAEHKLRIVRALKAGDAVVAMTGDGVNDAPAIKGADIGIAMGRTGTEVTKQAADMIITDDNFATIVAAVEEGRGIFANIRKTLQYLLAGGTGELLLMATCVVIGLPAPLLPVHLLWINLVTDGLPALCLATDPIDPEVMKHHPRRRTQSITDRSFLRTMALTGLLTGGVAFAVYFHCLKTSTPEMARSQAFAVLVFAELFRAFGARSATKPVWRIPLFSNINLVLVVVLSVGLQVFSQHNATFGRFLRTSAISFGDGFMLIALGAIPLVGLEIVKVIRHRWRSPASPSGG